MVSRGERGSGSGRWATVGLAVLAACTLVLCYLALTRDPHPPAGPDGAAGRGSADETASSPSGSAAAPPTVVDQVRADFSSATALPGGSRTYDNPTVGGPLQVSDGALTHPPPTGPHAIGTLEVQLPVDVQKLGATVLFPPGASGSVGLVAWTTSFVAARASGAPLPSSGMRLVASASSWELTVYHHHALVIGGDDFEAVDGPETFEVYRSGSTVWVVDPTGKVTRTADPLVGKLAGPWASWQVIEDTPRDTPARIQEVWAG